MRMEHGLRTLVLKLSLILIYFFSFNLNAKTLKVDTVTPSVTNGDFTIQKDGTGDIVLGSDSGFGVLTSGVLSTQASIDLASNVTGVLPVSGGGTNSSTALLNDLVMISSGGSIIESSTTSTELSFLDATSSIQTQIDGTVKTTGDQSIAGDKTVTGQFVAVSTTNGNRPCPVMTEAQKNAIATPSEGDCVVDSTNLELNFYLDSQWAQVGGGGGGGSGGINIVSDFSFENEELSPTLSTNGTVAFGYETYAVDAELYTEFNTKFYEATYSGVTASEVHLRDTFSRTGLDNKAGVFKIRVKSTTQSGQTLQLCLRVDDPTWSTACDNAYLVTIVSDDTWQEVKIPFIFGASSVEYEIFNDTYTGAAAIAVDVVELNIGSDNTTINDVDTDWITYTPTFTGFGTVSGVDFEYKRVGDSIIIRGTVDCGTTTAVEAQLGLPDSLVIKTDYSKSVVGTYFRGGVAASARGGSILATGGDTFLNFGHYFIIGTSGSSFDPHNEANGNEVCDAVTGNSFTTAQIPIQGWATGRTSAVSQRTERCEVEARNNSGESITLAVTNIPFAEVEDNCNAWDGAQFIAPYDATFIFDGSEVATTGSTRTIQAYKDTGSGYVSFERCSQSANSSLQKFQCVIKLNKDDKIAFRSDVTHTLFSSSLHKLSIKEIVNVDNMLGKFKLKKCQTKHLSSDISVSTNPVSDLTFSNLTAGKTYELFGQVKILSGSNNCVVNALDGSRVLARTQLTNDPGSEDRYTQTLNNPVFEMENGTSLTFQFIEKTTCTLEGNGSAAFDETWVTLCEYQSMVVSETGEW